MQRWLGGRALRVCMQRLTLSESSLRLRAAVAEHDKLLVAVARKRRELRRFSDKLDAARSQVATHLSPVADDLRRLDATIHTLLESLARDKRRPLRDRKQLEKLHADLRRNGTLSSRDAPPPPESAVKADPGAIRTLFRSLADALHPDKVQDEAQKASRTEIMKQVTVAYAQNDLARLVEIQRESAAVQHTDDSQRLAALTQTNAELAHQLRKLTLELRAQRASSDGRLARAVHQGAPVQDLFGPPDDQLVDLRRLQTALQSLQANRITLAQCLIDTSARKRS